ncbi:hypothetical protein [Tenacibaculum sp. M341]|uniref:hypothetical protein n=1 Tax=Tenacibaculum sp. M341 TaxID=2530339 RepID=UPI00104A34FD|nr:hypothetical protein [Tenacibaculum sp. M341]TCI92590.1 hypothetical protein EYW44_06730 [Tenacibaculum sp. M341]
MSVFEYEISKISNINSILPQNGNWYYSYLKNGNIRIHGTSTSFSSKKFAQKITSYGGYLTTKNEFINQKQLKMADNDTKKSAKSTDSGNSSTSLETLENEINQIEEIISETTIAKAYTKIVLTSTNSIGNTKTFQQQLDNNLGGKINTEAKAQIKQLIDQIKKELTSGKIVSAVYTSPTCQVILAPIAKGATSTTKEQDATITISKDNFTPATLNVTTEIEVDGVKVNSSKEYPISDNLFSTQDIINALAEFSAGRTFLNGLTTAQQTFTT